MPNRRKTDADEPAFRRLIDDVATADSARARAAIRAALQHEDGRASAIAVRTSRRRPAHWMPPSCRLAFRLETAVRREV